MAEARVYSRDFIATSEEKLRGIAKRVSDALWALDSARSELRKAQPATATGYRSAPGLGDKAWYLAMAENKVRKAEILVGDLALLAELGSL